MGDLRNKIAKQMAQHRHEAMLRRLYPKKPRQPDPKCQCGLTWQETPIQWWVQKDDFWRTATLCCPACLPYEHFADIIMDVANLPDYEACETIPSKASGETA